MARPVNVATAVRPEKQQWGPMQSTGRDTAHRACAARLRCGTVLTYEAPSFVPGVGETVPCRRHGFCSVVSRDARARDSRGGLSRAVGRRSQDELMEFLRRRPVTTVHVLRDERFTLRVVAAAEREGLLDLDLVSGRVALRTD